MWGIYLILGLQSLLIGWLVIQWFKFKSANEPKGVPKMENPPEPKIFSHDLEFKFKAPDKLPEYVVYPTHKNSNQKPPPTISKDKIKPPPCAHKKVDRPNQIVICPDCLNKVIKSGGLI